MKKRNNMPPKLSIETTLLSMIEKSDVQYKDLDRRLDNIEKVMIAQEINLKQHMERSNHLETIIQSIQEKDLQPLQKHVTMVEGVFKFLGLIALILTILTGIAKLYALI